MSHNPGGHGQRRARTSPWRARSNLNSGYPGALAPAGVPAFSSLLSERGDIDDAPLFHDPPGRESEETIPSDTDARAVARHAASGHGVRANHLPVHRDQSLSATVRSMVTLRSGMAARQDRVAALSCSRVWSAEARGIRSWTVDLVEPVEASLSHALQEHSLCGAHVVRSAGTGTPAERDRERHRQQCDREQGA